MGVRGRSLDETAETSSRIREALADAHEKWAVEVEEISGRMVIEAEREEFHPNGSSAGALALDHPKKPGWEVLAPGNQDVRWTAMYDTGGEAAVALAEITNIFEARRSIKHEQPSDWIVRAYYKMETLLLDSLKDDNQTV
ncbi:hypothetical protein [Halococcus thailandensis]|uniref:Uncharacterized protein n=1 Tax=Halococcus thailandensis JCM 13552 TaxID=1227457 RepID=M0NGR7_9EURY|nr:hypothetical protein [Halococcus thailandensis]EMA56758.1 hypothetical protein C451_00725 [Halococcus thailandensis JCM 13552]